ncbi:MAG: GNAT family protein [Candidatus Thorarchaeota archaeon]|nr:GNAT family protein [Candidatus Thorarchaeota archaeon]
MRVLLGGYIPVTRNMEKEWIQAAEESLKKRSEFHFAIEKLPEAGMIGSCALSDVDWLSRNCLLGIAIYAKKDWGQGLGFEALELLIDFGWSHLNLQRIELGVHSHNPRAKHVYEKLGFKHYGTAHGKYFINGEYIDTDLMELHRE